MNAWLIYDHEGAERNKDYIDYHYEVGSRYGVSFELKYVEDISESVINETPSFAVVRTIRPDINKLLEEKGIPTYNNYKVSYIANHKGRCMDYIKDNTTVPTIPTEVIHSTGVKDSIKEVLSDWKSCVVKPASGHGGIGVRRVPDNDSIIDEIEKELENDDIICQPFIDGPGEDVRVYVIGKEIIAAVKRKAPEGEFRANASLGGYVERYSLNDIEIDYVNQIINQFDFGMVGIDFIIDNNNQFLFSEIEDVVGARMLYKTHPEIDILNRYINHILQFQ